MNQYSPSAQPRSPTRRFMNHDDSIKKLKKDVVESYFENTNDSPKNVINRDQYHQIESSLENTNDSPRNFKKRSPRYNQKNENSRNAQQQKVSPSQQNSLGDVSPRNQNRRSPQIQVRIESSQQNDYDFLDKMIQQSNHVSPRQLKSHLDPAQNSAISKGSGSMLRKSPVDIALPFDPVYQQIKPKNKYTRQLSPVDPAFNSAGQRQQGHQQKTIDPAFNSALTQIQASPTRKFAKRRSFSPDTLELSPPNVKRNLAFINHDPRLEDGQFPPIQENSALSYKNKNQEQRYFNKKSYSIQPSPVLSPRSKKSSKVPVSPFSKAGADQMKSIKNPPNYGPPKMGGNHAKVQKYQPTVLEKIIYPEINLNMYTNSDSQQQHQQHASPSKKGNNAPASRVQHFKNKQNLKMDLNQNLNVNIERNHFQQEMDDIEPKSPMLQMWLNQE